MIKIKKIKEETIREEVIEAWCDFCEEKFDDMTVECNGYGQIVIGFGYGSVYDDERWNGEICDKCFDKHFKDKLRCKQR